MDDTAEVGELDVPVVASAADHGLILEITSMDLEAPALTGNVLLRCADGSAHRVPHALSDWAITMLAADDRHQHIHGTSLFPCRAAFKIIDSTIEVAVL
ncbi:hypothetical protein [Nocardia wallacei]|uniref:hypothetical protein n=1 Tax=Nocardia TaxID=1817 RepID=UPI002454B00D|nr:hypothetical protein [Nocardia wallacei]